MSRIPRSQREVFANTISSRAITTAGAGFMNIAAGLDRVQEELERVRLQEESVKVSEMQANLEMQAQRRFQEISSDPDVLENPSLAVEKMESFFGSVQTDRGFLPQTQNVLQRKIDNMRSQYGRTAINFEFEQRANNTIDAINNTRETLQTNFIASKNYDIKSFAKKYGTAINNAVLTGALTREDAHTEARDAISETARLMAVNMLSDNKRTMASDFIEQNKEIFDAETITRLRKLVSQQGTKVQSQIASLVLNDPKKAAMVGLAAEREITLEEAAQLPNSEVLEYQQKTLGIGELGQAVITKDQAKLLANSLNTANNAAGVREILDQQLQNYETDEEQRIFLDNLRKMGNLDPITEGLVTISPQEYPIAYEGLRAYRQDPDAVEDLFKSKLPAGETQQMFKAKIADTLSNHVTAMAEEGMGSMAIDTQMKIVESSAKALIVNNDMDSDKAIETAAEYLTEGFVTSGALRVPRRQSVPSNYAPELSGTIDADVVADYYVPELRRTVLNYAINNDLLAVPDNFAPEIENEETRYLSYVDFVRNGTIEVAQQNQGKGFVLALKGGREIGSVALRLKDGRELAFNYADLPPIFERRFGFAADPNRTVKNLFLYNLTEEEREKLLQDKEKYTLQNIENPISLVAEQ